MVEKNVFYEELNAVKGKLPIGDTLIVIGDLNANVGFDNTLLGHVIGNTVLATATVIVGGP